MIKDDSYGKIQKGRIADLVLLNANPLEDIKNTRSINAVVVDGKLLDRADLDRILGTRPRSRSEHSINCHPEPGIAQSDLRICLIRENPLDP
jgi:adenine deaminase